MRCRCDRPRAMRHDNSETGLVEVSDGDMGISTMLVPGFVNCTFVLQHCLTRRTKANQATGSKLLVKLHFTEFEGSVDPRLRVRTRFQRFCVIMVPTTLKSCKGTREGPATKSVPAQRSKPSLNRDCAGG
jgi:hypothetical protein